MVPRTTRLLGLTLGVLMATGCASVRARLPGSWLSGSSQANSLSAPQRATDLIPPEAIRVTSTEDRSISLAWNPVLIGDIAGYVIARSEQAQGPFAIVGRTKSRFGTVYSDDGDGPGSLGDGRTYFYRIHPVDSQGQMSRSHAFTSATTQSPPDTPTGLNVYSNLPRRAVLTWEPIQHWTVSGYGAYRAPTVAGPWEKVATVFGRVRAVYEDHVPGDLRVMYYRITAINRFGGESEMSEPVRAVTKAEPLPPIDLSVSERKLGSVGLRWAANIERDLESYEIWRLKTEGEAWSEPEHLASVPATATAFTDTTVGCGEPVQYRLRAIDADGLISDYSGGLELRGQDLGLRLEPLPDGLWRLRWDPDLAQGWAIASITQMRWAMPDRTLGEVRDESFFDLPDLGPRRTRLQVTLSNTIPGEDGSASQTVSAPRCEIIYAAGDPALLNPPAAAVD